MKAERLTAYAASGLFVYGVWGWLVWQVNIHPLFLSHQDEVAYTNIVLLVFSPWIYVAAKHHGDFYGRMAKLFVVAAMFACYTNSISGLAGGKDNTSDERQTKITEFGEWKTKIEKLEAQDNQLKEPKDYVYTLEPAYNASHETLISAADKVKRECDSLYIRRAQNSENAQNTCNKDRIAEETAQKDFNKVAIDYGYTIAKRNFAADIEKAKQAQRDLGVKPTFVDSAYGRISWLTAGYITEQQLRLFMPMLLAFLADAGFAFVPAMMMGVVKRKFVELWGERWWESTVTMDRVLVPPEVTVTPTIEGESHTHHEVLVTPTMDAEPPPEVKRLPPPKKAKRDDYVASVLAWKKTVTFTEQGDRYTSTELQLMCATFCQERGFPVVPLNVFGGILRNEGRQTPKKINGTDYYRMRTRPSLEVVKG